MKEKYSKYIKSRYGFVIDYYIQKNHNEQEDKLLVWTPKTRLSQPHEFEANKERIGYFENRKRNQYKIILNNQEQIIKNNTKTARRIIYTIAVLLITSSFILTGLNVPLLYTAICSISSMLTIFVSEISIAIVTENFKNELKIYKEYLDNCENIEKRTNEDENIKKHLDDKTISLINENETLKQQGYIENVYNTYLMDNIPKKQLKELLIRYKTSLALEEPLTFAMPNKNVKTRKKTPTPKSKYDKK